jgi:protein tyrosine phosphatase (PTP) superfamily phosphohydrolase (DUF442 family)
MNDMFNFMSYNERLTSSGMPTAEQMKSAAEAGVQMVINLAPHTVSDALAGEPELVESLGMRYVNIPVTWATPTQENLKKFMDEMDANHDKKIHVHCQANYRASAFIALYRILKLGWTHDDALEVMHKIWDEEDYTVWKMFIEDTLKGSQEDL